MNSKWNETKKTKTTVWEAEWEAEWERQVEKNGKTVRQMEKKSQTEKMALGFRPFSSRVCIRTKKKRTGLTLWSQKKKKKKGRTAIALLDCGFFSFCERARIDVDVDVASKNAMKPFGGTMWDGFLVVVVVVLVYVLRIERSFLIATKSWDWGRGSGGAVCCAMVGRWVGWLGDG
jgi:hypothetical protein